MSSSETPAPTPPEWLAANAGAPAAQRIAVTFLADMERRDLPAAAAAIGPDFSMVFPGAARYTRLEELVEGSRSRYKRVAKRLESVEGFSAGGADVVWVRGTLYGENAHGAPFEGIRFVDRFELRDGRLVSQDVWNDLAESGVLELRP